ncbi:hypothetical protein LCGC14_1526160 [marine sediment metagenome]|uniref:Uncharacterized protein n=1 Tax=marine sediment metagenome TaxID=412755 RepID=A0A0F9LY59_9ZZZZ
MSDRAEGPWEVDDIIQVSPGHDETFGAALLIVTEVKLWGIKGYVQTPDSGQVFYRLPYKQKTTEHGEVFPAGLRVGTAHWLTS